MTAMVEHCHSWTGVTFGFCEVYAIDWRRRGGGEDGTENNDEKV